MEKQFIITEKERDMFLSYLEQRPFKEVEGGVIMLRSLPELKKEEHETPEEQEI